MKKNQLKKLNLSKQVISNLNVYGGIMDNLSKLFACNPPKNTDDCLIKFSQPTRCLTHYEIQ